MTIVPSDTIYDVNIICFLSLSYSFLETIDLDYYQIRDLGLVKEAFKVCATVNLKVTGL